MIEYKLWALIEELSTGSYKTSDYLASVMNVSEKTVRTRIKELNLTLKDHGAEIISKQRCGYLLQVNKSEKWMSFIQEKDNIFDTTPTNSEERVRYLLFTLLNRMDYVKLSDISEFLYISKKTISTELKKVEIILDQFNLSIERKPYYGIRVIGHEFDMRCCLIRNFMLSGYSLPGMKERQEEGTKEIAKALLSLGKEYGLRFSESAFQNLVVYIFLSLSRMKQGMYVERPIEEEDNVIDPLGFEVADKLYQVLMKDREHPLKEDEIYYTGIYIAGKRSIGSGSEGKFNFVISEKIDNLVMEMLSEIHKSYKIEFRNNLNLRMMLNQHLMPMEIRIRYGIPLENPILDEIKDKHLFAFTMAQQACIPLVRSFGRTLSESEIGYIALSFALALEQTKSEIKKRNILLVCASGKASSQLLSYKFRQEFGDYIDTMNVCNVYELDHMEMEDYDYIFTTVPIFQKVNIPILEIHDILERYEIMAVKDLLQLGNLHFLKEFYKEDFFFYDIDGGTREEVLEQMCKKISERADLPEGFYESVLERESMGATDYGNLVAIPHPIKMTTDETIIAVGILKEALVWSKHPVRIVILVALSEEETGDVQKFYEVTTKFISNGQSVTRLIEKPNYETFVSLLGE